VGLVDAKLDLAEIDARISYCEAKLKENGAKLIAARNKVQELTELSAEAPKLRERERELSALFDDDLVKAQGRWTAEQAAMETLAESVNAITFTRPTAPEPATARMSPEHDSQYDRIRAAQADFEAAVDEAEKRVTASLTRLQEIVGEVKNELDTKFHAFKKQLDELLLENSGST